MIHALTAIAVIVGAINIASLATATYRALKAVAA